MKTRNILLIGVVATGVYLIYRNQSSKKNLKSECEVKWQATSDKIKEVTDKKTFIEECVANKGKTGLKATI